PLDGTVAFSEMNRIAEFIGQYLYFHMAENFNVLFKIYPRISECCCSFFLGNFDALNKLFFVTRDTDTFSASASCRFNYDWKTNFLRNFQAFHLIRNDTI